MRDARLIETTELLISDIDTKGRLRPVSDAAVQSLVVSIEQLGQMKDEIHVRKVAHQKGKLYLIAGGHRVAAALAMGWKTIPAKVWDCTDDWAALLEIDDNLAHAELNALELATFLAKRKSIYEKMHPETKAGIAGAKSRWDATDMMSFAKSTAEKRDLTERHIRRLVAIGEALSTYEINALRAMPKPVTLKDLQVLAKIKEDHVRVDVIDRLKHGTAKNATEALSAMSPKNPKHKDPIDEAHMKLFDLWKRSSKAAKKRFVRDFEQEITVLIAELGVSDAKH